MYLSTELAFDERWPFALIWISFRVGNLDWRLLVEYSRAASSMQRIDRVYLVLTQNAYQAFHQYNFRSTVCDPQ